MRSKKVFWITFISQKKANSSGEVAKRENKSRDPFSRPHSLPKHRIKPDFKTISGSFPSLESPKNGFNRGDHTERPLMRCRTIRKTDGIEH